MKCPGIEQSCCEDTNNMPWFNRSLNEITTENIELRVCTNSLSNAENIPLEIIELFVG